MKRLIIFASGSGTNAQNIIQHFKYHKLVKVVLVLTNNKDAKVLDRCKVLKTNSLVFSKDELMSAKSVNEVLKQEKPDLIILAGFLLKFPEFILKEFPNKVINLHPALLPKYGGKGMFGHHVHKAVIANNEKETGITFHYVNENYDEGAIIFQKSVSLEANETPDTVAKKIHELEHAYFPKVIEDLLFPAHK
ncbi:phosphoribosylglycinamide formyltransferase [Candidatus Marifrigoribacter sp. Uisw_064]|uniref:phosphoribosylglycinamide formyltransferase n=1 Tax=Candidatus Marifrigoribacter sp. Uisw_064 TaxID=3230970 RepID=UPI003D47CDE4